ncbi:MAG TPA: DUF167 domain-containing protein [Thermomicrobiaceae bacterium]|nr:DUF167 domain-containing protein [Thermomicrobiaceae bacterium]
MSLPLRETADGVVVPVRVVPRAGRTELDRVVDGVLRVRLAAAPVEGAANRELCEYLAGILNLPKRDVEIASGARSRQKSVRITGIGKDEVRARLGLC